MISEYPVLSQQDYRWGNKKMPFSSETIASVGCLFTSRLMMILRGVPFKPEYIDAFMKCQIDNGNYTQSGGAWLQSQDLSKCRPPEWGPVELAYASGSFPGPVPQADLERLVNHVAGGKPALMCVDNSLAQAGLQEHWVLLTATDGDNMMCHDPWRGDCAALEPRFGASLSKACWKYVLFDCPPAPETVPGTDAPASEPATPPVINTTQWAVDIYGNDTLSGTPLKSVALDYLNYEWGVGAVLPGGPSDLFSVRAVRKFESEAASYRVAATADDGVRVYIDDKIVLDHWVEEPATDYSAYVDLAAGIHTIRVEYFERGGQAVLKAPMPVKGTPPVAAIPNRKVKLGVNSITSDNAAIDASNKGCRFHLLIDAVGVGQDIKRAHPDADVVIRRYTAHDKLDGSQLAARIGGSNDGLWYETLNEGDNWSYGAEDELRTRIDVDITATQILLARGTNVVMGGFSMGCPNFLDPKIVEQMKRYAPLYNSNSKVGFSLHNYSPSYDHIFADDALKWYERRWEFLFTHCGFDPLAGVKIFLTETGIDGDGDGIAKAGLTDEQLARFIQRWIEVQSRPLVVNGISYPSPVVGGAIFCYCLKQNQQWMGYDVAGQAPALQKYAWS